MVWLIPGPDGAQFQHVTLMTYLISAGGFTHVIAGALEAFLLVVNGDVGPRPIVSYFAIPVLLANIIGGTALFVLVSHAQMMQMIKEI